MVAMPPLFQESHNQPLAPGRWPNLNTVEHYQNSQIMQNAVLKYILTHPAESFAHAVRRIGRLLMADTSIYSHKPHHWLFWIYKPLVWISCIWIFTNAVLLIVDLKKYRLRVLGIPENILLILTVYYICMLAIGEAGEEARFLISVLPLIAALPDYKRKVPSSFLR